MNIDRDIIIDLLPLYVSGEASPATLELVRDYLQRDPELARLAREQEASFAAPLPSRTLDMEAISFQRTRSRVVAQRWAFGLAWLFTAVTFSTEIRIEAGHITAARLALSDAPLLLGLVATAATASWLAYLNLRNRA